MSEITDLVAAWDGFSVDERISPAEVSDQGVDAGSGSGISAVEGALGTEAGRDMRGECLPLCVDDDEFVAEATSASNLISENMSANESIVVAYIPGDAGGDTAGVREVDGEGVSEVASANDVVEDWYGTRWTDVHDVPPASTGRRRARACAEASARCNAERTMAMLFGLSR
jgi:hypothetical protein